MDGRVLCVDDDPATQMVLNGIIADAGWRPEPAMSATAAREVLASSPEIQVVLLDWMLPDGSGVDLCRELKASHGASLYVILVTVRAAPEDVETGLDAGADDYLVKPVSPAARRTSGAARARLEAREQPGKPAAALHVLSPHQQLRDLAVGRGLPVGSRGREGVARLLPGLPLEAHASARRRVIRRQS